MSNIRIDIASEFKDKGFKKAEKATSGLDKQLKKLAVTLGATFSVRQIGIFAKQSVKAFIDDDKAAQQLTATLGNLGLAFEDPRIKEFLSSMEQTSGVLDDELRPAFETLIRTTGSAIKSQELLASAIDISRGSGIDLQTVTKDLSQAFLGNNKSLSKYNTGLTKAELKLATFTEIQAALNEQYKGQNARYLETYAGQISLLNVAYANMQETIGKGLVDAFVILQGEAGLAGGTRGMYLFAEAIADVTRGSADAIMSLGSFSKYASNVLTLIRNINLSAPIAGALAGIQEIGSKNKSLFFPTAGIGDPAERKAREKAEKEAAKRAKELLILQQKAAAAAKKAAAEAAKREREQAQLKRAGTVFDMENIQIVAAMQGQIDGEQRLRLVALLALNNGVAEAAEKAASAVLAINAPALANLGVIVKAGDSITDVINKLIVSQAKVALVDLGITNLPKAKNPFEDWLSIMDKIIKNLDTIASKIKGLPTPTTTGVTGGGTGGGGTGGGGSTGGGGNGAGGTFTVPNPFNPSSPGVSTTDIGTSIDTLLGLRAGAPAGSPISFLLKEHIDTLTNSLTLSSMSNLSDEQARLRAMGFFDTPGITAGSTFDPGSFRRRDEGGVTVIVQGSVITETDLAEIITDIQYDYQKAGKDLLLSSTAI